MTRHKALHTGLVSPSPLDLWINALLRGLAMLVSFVRSICSMRQTRSLAECHSDATLKALPCKESGKLKDPTQAAASSHASSSSNAEEGLILRTIALAILDSTCLAEAARRRRKHEAGLTSLPTGHPRACPEDPGSHSGGTLTGPHDPTTEIPGMRGACPRAGLRPALGAYPRMTRCWVCAEIIQACAPS
jgi:hypothetical protein